MIIKLTGSWSIRVFTIYYITFLTFRTFCAAHSSSQTTVVKHTTSHDPTADGFWKRNVHWKSRWVKYWRPKAIYVPIWKKVWSPVVQNEWVPLPKVPSGWEVSKNGIIDSTNSGWSSRSDVASSSNSGSSRSAKSYSGGVSRSTYDSNGWRKGVKRMRVREVDVE